MMNRFPFSASVLRACVDTLANDRPRSISLRADRDSRMGKEGRPRSPRHVRVGDERSGRRHTHPNQATVAEPSLLSRQHSVRFSAVQTARHGIARAPWRTDTRHTWIASWTDP